MRSHIRIERTYRITGVNARQVPRPVVVRRPIARTVVTVPQRVPWPASAPFSPEAGFQPDPYEDYGRFLTPEGGILICYKDIDDSLRHTLWWLFAWTVSTGIEGWYLLYQSPVHALWLNIILLIAMAIINWLIVRKPVEIYRKIEIRPDCMILEERDVFWRRYMENGWPSFQGQTLCGIYGSRFVEFLTVRQFDEFDRMPQVFAAHLQDAIRQLWSIHQVY